MQSSLSILHTKEAEPRSGSLCSSSEPFYVTSDPKHLLHFFECFTSEMGDPQNLFSFSILVVSLCNLRFYAHMPS
jgi:hypothetical protein